MASLTETAKAVLMKENYPSVSPNGAGSPDRDAKSSNPNLATLKPNSKTVVGRHSNPDATPVSEFDKVEDLGPALTKQGDVPPSAKAAGKVSKDTSKSSKSSVAAEPSKGKPTEVMEEDETEGEVVAEESKKSKFMAMLKKKRKGSKEEEEEELEEAKKHEEEEEGSKKSKKLDEEVELDEELAQFIDALVAEGYSEDEIVQAIEENFEFVNEESEYEVDMAEHVEALFHGEDLSEEFKAKALTIFEAAVKQKVEEEIAVMEQAFAETLEEEINSIQEELSSNVDDYLNYVVEQWVAENEIAIESGLRTELTEDFISGLRQLFAENYIDIPDDKVSVVEALGDKVEELESKLNEEIERNVALNKMLSESKKVEVINDLTEGLTSTQAEKLKSLSEGIEFTDADEFAQKVMTIRENYFPSNGVRTSNVLDSVESNSDGKGMISEELQGPMSAYVKVLGRSLPK
jgi:hypothetical protein